MSQRKGSGKKAKPQTGHPSRSGKELGESGGFRIWPLSVLLLVTGAVFWPMLFHEFTNWDDEFYVVKNAMLQGPDWKGIFTQPVVSNYHPLTMLSLALNYQVSGLDPFSYFLVNWVLHLANTVLVFLLVWRISNHREWVALFTATVFALHPMHVESVAWISERKDVLYAFFFLGAMLQYWRYLESQRWRDFIWVTVWFLLSLLSKPAAVVLPLVLLLLDFWKGRSFTQRVWLEKLPLLALSLLFGILTLTIQSKKALASLEIYSLADRFFFGCYGWVAYLERFFLPAPLSAFHPYPDVQKMGLAIRLAPLLLLVLAATIMYFRKNKVLVFGALFYTVNLVLVLQFLAIGNTLLSERYTYVPYIGVAFSMAMLFQQWLERRGGKDMGKWFLLILVALVAGYVTRQQVRVWKDSETLWSQVIRHYPSAKIPRTNRARYLYDLAILPENATREKSLLAVVQEDCTVALNKDPRDYNALDMRASVLLRNRIPGPALTDAEALVRLYPDSLRGYVLRSFANSMLKQYDATLADCNYILSRDSNDADIYNRRGTALFNGKQQYREALLDFEKAISIRGDGEFYLNRSNCHYVLGDPSRALADAEKAQALGTNVDPGHLEMLKQLSARKKR